LKANQGRARGGMQKRARGRPKKKEDSLEPWQFGRAAIVLSAYDESRGKGEKHSAAVSDAVEFLRRCSPEVRISKTGVKRILSQFRPRGSGAVLRFERSPWTEEDKKRYSLICEHSAAFAGRKGIILPRLPAYHETHHRDKFLIRFSERPEYPRHNRKASKK
jgi:hypothetical protein